MAPGDQPTKPEAEPIFRRVVHTSQDCCLKFRMCKIDELLYLQGAERSEAHEARSHRRKGEISFEPRQCLEMLYSSRKVAHTLLYHCEALY